MVSLFPNLSINTMNLRPRPKIALLLSLRPRRRLSVPPRHSEPQGRGQRWPPLFPNAPQRQWREAGARTSVAGATLPIDCPFCEAGIPGVPVQLRAAFHRSASRPRRPGSRAPSSPSAMAAAGGPGADRRCPFLGLLLLLIAGPAQGWKDPGECRLHLSLPVAFSLLWEAPRATIFVCCPVSFSALIPHFQPLRYSSVPFWGLLVSQASEGRGDCWELMERDNWIFLTSPFFPGLLKFAHLHLPRATALTLGVWLESSTLTCASCFVVLTVWCLLLWLLSWLPVAMAASSCDTGSFWVTLTQGAASL